MKKLVLLIALVVSGISYGQAGVPSENMGSNNQVYMGQDENGYPIYKNIKPFESIGSKIAVSVFGVFVSGVTTLIIHDKREDKREEEKKKEVKKEEK